uniref:Wu:fc23c09 n=1 Tax=Amphiprion ocellaris TaxID=80972 RepID=A0AAQ5XH33_AMPOC
ISFPCMKQAEQTDCWWCSFIFTRRHDFCQSTHLKLKSIDYRMIWSSLCTVLVQCSDKGVNTVPYGIPYNARYILLMNNHINSIQLDLFNDYTSMEFLVLSNNQLTDGAIEGAFEGIPALKRLYLDKNLLKSVPNDLPVSLEEDSLLNATHLESLNLEGNRLKQVPRHLPPSLKTLNLQGNLISSIKKATFSSLKNLEHLGLARNKIFKVAPGAFRTLSVLHQLDMSHNTLRQVPRQLPQGLHSVALTHNKIQSVPRDAFCWGNKSLSGLVQVQLEHNLIDLGKLDAQAFRCLRGFQVVHFY